MKPMRVSAEIARAKIINDDALFVCAYETEDKFAQNHLQGAISLKAFKSRLPALSKQQEIIFY